MPVGNCQGNAVVRLYPRIVDLFPRAHAMTYSNVANSREIRKPVRAELEKQVLPIVDDVIIHYSKKEKSPTDSNKGITVTGISNLQYSRHPENENILYGV